jgi:hypothetical protein
MSNIKIEMDIKKIYYNPNIINILEKIINSNFKQLFSFYSTFDLEYLNINIKHEYDKIRNILYYTFAQFIEIRTEDFILDLFPLYSVLDCYETEESLIIKEFTYLAKFWGENFLLEILNDEIKNNYFFRIDIKKLPKAFNHLNVDKDIIITPVEFWKGNFRIIHDLKTINKNFIIGFDVLNKYIYIGVY